MKKVGIGILLALILVSVAIAGYYKQQKSKQVTGQLPHSFEECQAAGYPVQESYPARCSVGKITFVQTISEQPDVHAPNDGVTITSPTPNAVIQSPVRITGQAVGEWYFEAVFPVAIVDEDGKELGKGIAHAQGEWMTDGLVPYIADVTFEPGGATSGYIEAHKDNPSGLPELDAFVRIPVKFK